MKNLILGIETSCDDTCLSIVDEDYNVLYEKKYSQDYWNNKYGGVVPELASRMHVENIELICNDLRNEISKYIMNLKFIAVTKEPGLIGSLIVGLSFAKGLALNFNIPLHYVNHLRGHLFSILINNENKNIQYPALFLLVSGGHSQIVLIEKKDDYQIISQTLDDAAGEAFDKVAKLLGLEPNGRSIENRALLCKESIFKFKPSMMNKKDINFSFSGLKTQILYKFQKFQENNLITDEIVNQICFSTEEAIVKTFEYKLNQVLFFLKKEKNIQLKDFIICGGVAANKKLRNMLNNFADINNLIIKMPDIKYSTDNASMIAIAAMN